MAINWSPVIKLLMIELSHYNVWLHWFVYSVHQRLLLAVTVRQATCKALYVHICTESFQHGFMQDFFLAVRRGCMHQLVHYILMKFWTYIFQDKEHFALATPPLATPPLPPCETLFCGCTVEPP